MIRNNEDYIYSLTGLWESDFDVFCSNHPSDDYDNYGKSNVGWAEMSS